MLRYFFVQDQIMVKDILGKIPRRRRIKGEIGRPLWGRGMNRKDRV